MPEFLESSTYFLFAKLFLVSNNMLKQRDRGLVLSLPRLLSLLAVYVVAEIHSFGLIFL